MAASNLRFFCAFVLGGEDPFLVVDRVENLPLANELPVEDRDRLRDLIQPLAIRDEDGSWVAKATVFYGDTLFGSSCRLSCRDKVEVFDDEPLMADMPVCLARYDCVWSSHATSL